HGIRLEFLQQRQQPVVVLGDIEVHELDRPARDFLPGGEAGLHGTNWGQRTNFQFVVDIAPRQVVDDDDLVLSAREVKGGRPAAEAVSSQDQYLHDDLFAGRNGTDFLKTFRQPSNK